MRYEPATLSLGCHSMPAEQSAMNTFAWSGKPLRVRCVSATANALSASENAPPLSEPSPVRRR